MPSPLRLPLPLLFALLASAFAETPPTPLYETREEHDRNGIGKFFMGREIAHVMGHQAADWLERPEREEEEKTDLMIESLKFREGEIVADIGCGSGYIARRIAKKVGATGIVYGVEIQQDIGVGCGCAVVDDGQEADAAIAGKGAGGGLPPRSEERR